MIMPIDIDKKEFSRDKRGYNSREVDEFLDLITVDYERVLNDNRNMAHKIKSLEKQLEEAQKSDTAMVETLETAKKLMADISASAERRAELIMRDAELESETMILDAKMTVKKLNDEHLTLKNKVERLRANYKTMLTSELEKLELDEYALLPDIDRSDLTVLDEQFKTSGDENVAKQETIVVKDKTGNTVAVPDSKPVLPVTDMAHATVSDLSESLKKMAQEQQQINDTIILK
jgi:cell division initiation protein